jgi:hypothetical protein
VCAATARAARGGGGGGGQPADLTDEVWDYGSSDGEIFVVLRDGTSVDLEGYGESVSESDLWNLVNYLRELQTKSEERRTKN